uniref:Uncharacterized protein n=1 Tax=Knipowitschia caucasica TaxID=637954 RepID=A0AAV2KY43_KNICA
MWSAWGCTGRLGGGGGFCGQLWGSGQWGVMWSAVGVRQCGGVCLLGGSGNVGGGCGQLWGSGNVGVMWSAVGVRGNVGGDVVSCGGPGVGGG